MFSQLMLFKQQVFYFKFKSTNNKPVNNNTKSVKFKNNKINQENKQFCTILQVSFLSKKIVSLNHMNEKQYKYLRIKQYQQMYWLIFTICIKTYTQLLILKMDQNKILILIYIQHYLNQFQMSRAQNYSIQITKQLQKNQFCFNNQNLVSNLNTNTACCIKNKLLVVKKYKHKNQLRLNINIIHDLVSMKNHKVNRFDIILKDLKGNDVFLPYQSYYDSIIQIQNNQNNQTFLYLSIRNRNPAQPDFLFITQYIQQEQPKSIKFILMQIENKKICKVAWHPNSTMHLIYLTQDSMLIMYNIFSDMQNAQLSINLNSVYKKEFKNHFKNLKFTDFIIKRIKPQNYFTNNNTFNIFFVTSQEEFYVLQFVFINGIHLTPEQFMKIQNKSVKKYIGDNKKCQIIKIERTKFQLKWTNVANIIKMYQIIHIGLQKIHKNEKNYKMELVPHLNGLFIVLYKNKKFKTLNSLKIYLFNRSKQSEWVIVKVAKFDFQNKIPNIHQLQINREYPFKLLNQNQFQKYLFLLTYNRIYTIDITCLHQYQANQQFTLNYEYNIYNPLLIFENIGIEVQNCGFYVILMINNYLYTIRVKQNKSIFEAISLKTIFEQLELPLLQTETIKYAAFVSKDQKYKFSKITNQAIIDRLQQLKFLRKQLQQYKHKIFNGYQQRIKLIKQKNMKLKQKLSRIKFCQKKERIQAIKEKCKKMEQTNSNLEVMLDFVNQNLFQIQSEQQIKLLKLLSKVKILKSKISSYI